MPNKNKPHIYKTFYPKLGYSKWRVSTAPATPPWSELSETLRKRWAKAHKFVNKKNEEESLERNMKKLCFEDRWICDVKDGKKGQSVRSQTNLKREEIFKLCDEDGVEFARAKCIGINEVEIDSTEMSLNGERLFASIQYREQSEPTDNEFAEADGFEGFMEMADYIKKQYGSLPFKGVVIQWTLYY